MNLFPAICFGGVLFFTVMAWHSALYDRNKTRRQQQDLVAYFAACAGFCLVVGLVTL